MQVSAHAKQRMEERLANYSSTEKPINVFKAALRYGKTTGDFVGDFRDYLDLILTKQRGTDVRVYADNVFLFEVRKKILITVWNIPEEYEPYKNYLKCNQPLINAEKLKEDRKVLKVVLKEGYTCDEFSGSFDDYLRNLCDTEIDVRVYDKKIYLFNPEEQSIIDILEIPEYYRPVDCFLTVVEGKEGNDVRLDDIVSTRPAGDRKPGPIGKSLFAEYDSKLLEVGYKECRKCGEVKKLESFALNKAASDGRQSYCNECRRQSYVAKTSEPTEATSTVSVVTVTASDPVVSKPSTDSTFDVSTINQVFGFSEYLKENNISDEEFIRYVEGFGKNILNALEVYSHLSEESKDLYLKMRKGN